MRYTGPKELSNEELAAAISAAHEKCDTPNPGALRDLWQAHLIALLTVQRGRAGHTEPMRLGTDAFMQELR